MENKTHTICLIVNSLGRGGAERVVLDLASHLDPQRYEPLIVTLRRGVEEFDVPEGVRVHDLGFSLLSAPITLLRLMALLRRNDVALLHTHLFHADVLGRLAACVVGVPVIATLHNVRIGAAWRILLLRLLAPLARKKVCVSQEVARWAQQEGIGVSKTIYNGIDTERFDALSKVQARQKLGIAKEERIIVLVGSLTHQKGFDLVPRIAASLPDVKWLIAGEGPQRKNLELVIQKEGVRSRVLLLGSVDDVAPYLAAADIFVMPSRWEGLPVALLEAGAAGLPVVATKAGGIPEVVGEDGMLVAVEDVAALAEKIRLLFAMEEDKREEMGALLRSIIERRFSVVEMVRQYQNLYNEIISKL